MTESSIWNPGEGGGSVGPPGPAGTITVGIVTTGQPGTPVIVLNRGTASAAILDFTIPQGNTGIGIQGPVGPPGPSVQGPQGEPGIQGNQGLPGQPGSKILPGAGAPSNATGVDGDYYLDQANALLYGPKSAGIWTGTFINLRPGATLVYEDFAPLTGATITLANLTTNAIVVPAGTIAALTVAIPSAANSFDGKKVKLFFQAAVTALTVTSSGATLRGAPSSAAANSWATLQFRASNATWYRIS